MLLKRYFLKTAFILIYMVSMKAVCQYNKTLLELKKKSGKELPAVLIKEIKALPYKSYKGADKALYNRILADYYESTNQDDKALTLLLEAKKIYKSIDSTDALMDTNLGIYSVIYYSNTNTTDPINYLRDYITYIEKTDNKDKKSTAYVYLADYYQEGRNAELSRKYYKKALKLCQEIKDDRGIYIVYTNMSMLYSGMLKKPDSSIYFLNKTLPYLEKQGTVEDKNYYLVNMAASYRIKKNYKKSVEYLLEAFNQKTERAEYGYKQASAEELYETYKEAQDYKNAFKFQELAYRYSDSMKEQERNIAKNDIESKYRAKEKELENKVLKSDVKVSKLVTYATGTVSAALVVIGFLIVKNARRKEKISHQETLIEQQKLEKTLKEHELQIIDTMLEGQERERQRIANDLHDNLGSMLATLKLNFENLRMRKKNTDPTDDVLYERTDELIDEAYHKVRRLAHGKNAGVMSGDGLIPAVKKLAEKISVPGKIEMQFIPYGFTTRLDNTLEINIFRTIQELCTNIIKHSQATEASIQLTHHEDSINIIIEDNGVGFNTATLSNDGMGLGAIQKKIEQLNGTFEVDSTPGKGTTIIIDIPV